MTELLHMIFGILLLALAFYGAVSLLTMGAVWVACRQARKAAESRGARWTLVGDFRDEP